MRRSPGLVATIGVALVAATLFVAWLLPSGDYLYLPNPASPVAGSVVVSGKPDPPGPGGIYYVDVTVRPARWLERLLPFTRPDGATIVPGRQVESRGATVEERRRRGAAEMSRSEEIAAAVGLREAGLDVTASARGVLVESIATDVPAAKILDEDDVIVEAAGRPTKTPLALRDAMKSVTPGDPVKLSVMRDGKELELTAVTVPSPADQKHAILGIAVSQDADIRLPVDVRIDLGRVGGPSAGLPFALEVLQETGRDVDRGHRVAATGEIELDGSVGPIGGVKQKTLGVKAAGVDVFLVPAGDNAREARRYAGTLRVIPVESFQQALRVLKTLPQK